MERMLLIMPKDLKYYRLGLDVFHEGFRHFHGNLAGEMLR